METRNIAACILAALFCTTSMLTQDARAFTFDALLVEEDLDCGDRIIGEFDVDDISDEDADAMFAQQRPGQGPGKGPGKGPGQGNQKRTCWIEGNVETGEKICKLKPPPGGLEVGRISSKGKKCDEIDKWCLQKCKDHLGIK